MLFLGIEDVQPLAVLATGLHWAVQGIYGRLDVLVGGAGVAGRGVDIPVAQHLLGGGKASRTAVKRLGEVPAQLLGLRVWAGKVPPGRPKGSVATGKSGL